MIRFVAAAVILAGSVSAHAAERSFAVGGFDRLAVGGSASVTVVTGRAASMRASGAQGDLDKLQVKVEGRVLKINQDWAWHEQGPVTIAITMPVIRSVDAAGSGIVTVDRVKTGGDFAGKLAGSGALRLPSIDAASVSFESAGSGSISAAGRCSAGSAKIAGSGDLKLAGLKCETFSGSVAGSGTIDAFASRTATLSTVGSGDINLSGGARCTVSSAGSGKARCV